MYNLIIKDNCCSNVPYENRIILYDLTLEEAFDYISSIEGKNKYYYEIIRQDED